MSGKAAQRKAAQIVELAEPTNGAANTLALGEPYMVDVEITGVADLILHCWNCEAITAKSNAAKGSKGKRSDDLESYVVRDSDGMIGMPGGYIRAALADSARFEQDPRSPRKSLRDMIKAAVHSMTPISVIGPARDHWDYEWRGRMVVQRQGINRTLPAFKAGWVAPFRLLVTLPEYVSPEKLASLITRCGQINGIAEFRPTYGRFNLTKFEVVRLDETDAA